MKIFTEIVDLLGKKVYHDKRLEKLRTRFNPKKVTFISLEFINQNIDSCECIVTSREKLTDFIIQDLEKIEPLLGQTPHDDILKKAINILEQEKVLFSCLTKEELGAIKEYAFATAKPVVFFLGEQLDGLMEKIIKESGYISFFTVNKNESKEHIVKGDTPIVEGAYKIHTDLAKGFIRAEVYNMKDLDSFKNPEEAKSKGLLRIVDKDYLIADGDVINIRFKI